MSLVLAVTWIAKPGNEAAMREILLEMSVASRQEAGLISFRYKL